MGTEVMGLGRVAGCGEEPTDNLRRHLGRGACDDGHSGAHEQWVRGSGRERPRDPPLGLAMRWSLEDWV